MNATMKTPKHKNQKSILSEIVKLDKAIKSSNISGSEKGLLEVQQRFDAVYHSNKLEGNRLSKEEVKKAILLNS